MQFHVTIFTFVQNLQILLLFFFLLKLLNPLPKIIKIDNTDNK